MDHHRRAEGGISLYRKLFLWPLVLFWVLAVLAGYHLTGLLGRPVAAGLLTAAGSATQSSAVLVATLSLRKLAAFGLGAALVWGAAFHPGRWYHPLVSLLKYGAGVAALALSLFVIYQKAATAGEGARLLSEQAGMKVAELLAFSQAPHMTIELLALAPVLVAPIYALFRAVQVRSLQRAWFEAWVELRQRMHIWAPLLVVAALVEVYVTPAAVAFIFQ